MSAVLRSSSHNALSDGTEHLDDACHGLGDNTQLGNDTAGFVVLRRQINKRQVDLVVYETRGAYHAALAPIHRRLIELEQTNGPIDLIVLAFRKSVTGALLRSYCERMINVHPADLSVYDTATRSEDMSGTQGLRTSIEDGNAMTRTSVHFVTEGVDRGPLICIGPDVTFEGDRLSVADIEAHERKQKAVSDRAALRRALELIAYPQTLPAQTPCILQMVALDALWPHTDATAQQSMRMTT